MAAQQKIANPVVKLNNVRLSFPHLWTPQKGDDEGSKPKYSATFLLDKKANAKDIAAMKAAIQSVLDASLKTLFKNRKPSHVCLRDGAEKEHLEGYTEDNMFVAARTHKRPGTVNRDLTPVAEEDGVFFAGCYVNATVDVYPFVHPKSGSMICASLRAVQFVKKGEPFGEKPVDASEEFAAMADDDEGVI